MATVYANAADIPRFGVRADALSGISTEAQQAALSAASGLIDSYLGARFTLPVRAPWPESLRRAAVIVAVYDLLVTRGYGPSVASDEHVRRRYEDVIRWLEHIRDGAGGLSGVVDSSTGDEDAPVVLSDAALGWPIAGGSESYGPPVDDDAVRTWGKPW